jgi:hypothetical protein
MLEDHSPTSRSSSRKPFRRKGGKTVIFNSSCVYYQLDCNYYSSDAEDDDHEQEDAPQEEEVNQLDEAEGEIRTEDDTNHRPQYRKTDTADLDESGDYDFDQPQTSLRMGPETMDVSGNFAVQFPANST